MERIHRFLKRIEVDANLCVDQRRRGIITTLNRIINGLRTLILAVLQKNISSILLASPVILVLSAFIIVPIMLITIVSFWGSTEFSIYPAFIFDNYEFLLTSDVTYRVFFRTLYFTVLVWAITLFIGFIAAMLYFSGVGDRFDRKTE